MRTWLLAGSVALLGLWTAGMPGAAAQSQDSGGAGRAAGDSSVKQTNRPTYTLRINSRVVLTDVTVTDTKGNPVHGLSRAAFHVFDDGHEQVLDSFREHAESGVASGFGGSVAAGLFSNRPMVAPPPVVNAILIDTTTIAVVDQMFLYQQLTRLVDRLPAGVPLAVFYRSGGVTLLLQDFTSDHGLLLTAIRKAIPHLRQPGAWYTSDFETLHQVALYLRETPGRKNVIWFTGGSTLFLSPNPDDLPVGFDPRPVYDELEAERIAIYPVDARGLMVASSMRTLGVLAAQHLLMEADAEATGGRALINSNGLARFAANVMATDGSYYTLTYSPDDLRQDNKWHTVKIKLDGTKYRLSYRRGYYDDGQNHETSSPGRARILLGKNGEKQQVIDSSGAPIEFQAQVVPASAAPASVYAAPPPKRGQTTYTVRYIVPAADFNIKPAGNQLADAVIGAAIVAFNHYGTLVARAANQITVELNQEKARTTPNATLSVYQQVNLPKGDNYLTLAVWDMTTGRMGMLNVPLLVKSAEKKH